MSSTKLLINWFLIKKNSCSSISSLNIPTFNMQAPCKVDPYKKACKQCSLRFFDDVQMRASLATP